MNARRAKHRREPVVERARRASSVGAVIVIGQAPALESANFSRIDAPPSMSRVPFLVAPLTCRRARGCLPRSLRWSWRGASAAQDVSLKLSRELAPPATRRECRAGAATDAAGDDVLGGAAGRGTGGCVDDRTGSPTRRAVPARRPPRRRAQDVVEAEGKVELRSRHETVLADWLRYDIPTGRDLGEGQRRAFAAAIDWITGPEARFKRDNETGSFARAAVLRRRGDARGDATEIRLRGSRQVRSDRRRYTTCVAPQTRLVPDAPRSSRSTAAHGRHRARRDRRTSWTCRCCIRRGWSSRCPTSASRDSSRPRSARPACAGFEVARRTT